MARDSVNHQQIPGYEILARLGSGGMATVYKARQISLDRVVALKILPSSYTHDPEFVSRFYAEGKAAAKLNHPNIVGALDVGQANGFHYFVMEYVEGVTVFDELAENVRYDEDEALPVLVQVARGLDHAHKAKLIHRDIKPQNIIITRSRVAKISDLGLAAAVGEGPATADGKIVVYGSPYYMAPEQARAEHDLDFRADIYGFGATAYYMLTGRVPFDAPTPVEVMRKHLTRPLIPPQRINAALSDGISQVIAVCMAKKREERYDATEHLVEDLAAVSIGEAPLHAGLKLDPDAAIAGHQRQTDFVSAAMSESGNNHNHHAAASARRGGPETMDTVSMLRNPLFWLAMMGWCAAAAFAALWVQARLGN